MYNAFEHRFADLQKHEIISNIFVCPFSTDMESAPKNLELLISSQVLIWNTCLNHVIYLNFSIYIYNDP